MHVVQASCRRCSPGAVSAEYSVAVSQVNDDWLRDIPKLQKMRDNGDYRAANGRAQAAVLQPSPGLALRLRRRFSHGSATGRAESCPRPYLRPPPLHGHPLHWYPFQWYGYHSYGMHSQWNGLVCNALQCIAYQWIAIDCLARRATGRGKRPTSPGALSLQFR